VALDSTTCPPDMDVGAATLDVFDVLGDRCGCKGGTMTSSGDSVRLSTSSPCGGGGEGGAR
jgi:hypothetical protein